MRNVLKRHHWRAAMLTGLVVLAGTGAGMANNMPATPQTVQDVVDEPDDVIARVGGEVVPFSLLNTMLNSSAMVGLSIPALGTVERQQVIITLLDKAISANLLYLDALQQGVDKQADYQRDIRQFENAVLASLYKTKHLLADVTVSEEEITEYYRTSVKKDTELTADVRTAITAVIRKQKLSKRKTTLRQRIRDGVRVEIDAAVLDPVLDDARKAPDVVAKITAKTSTRVITWGETKTLLQGADLRVERAAFYLDDDVERRKRLDGVIDTVIMADRARQAGLESDRSYRERTREFRKTRLINLHRSRLIESWSPSDAELKTYFDTHRDRIMVPEMRKIQMVLLKTQQEAEAVKQKIDSGEITIFQAALQYSIDPNARNTLGEMGWVARDTGFRELDDLTFLQEPEELGGPVESPAGWHLVKVLDVQDAQRQYFEDPGARRAALRMFIRERLDQHVIALRTGSFEVTVNEAELGRQFQQEATFVASLTEQAGKEGSLTERRQEDLKKWMQ